MGAVTSPLDEHDEIGFLDGRDYRLIVLLDHDHRVEILHQHAGDVEADQDMVRIAAEIAEEVGLGAVEAVLDTIVAARRDPADPDQGVVPPPPGVAVLACRCGRVIDTSDCRWLPTARPDKAGPVFPRIVCPECAP